MYYGSDFSECILDQDPSNGLSPGTRTLTLISDSDTDDSDPMSFMTEIRVVNPDELVIDYHSTLGCGPYGEVFTAKFTAGKVNPIRLFSFPNINKCS